MTDHMSPQQIYQEHGFYLVKNFIPRVLANYLKEILHTLRVTNQLGNGDGQVENSFVVYGNPAFDTFGYLSTPSFSQIIGKPLSFTYTYSRVYLNNAALLPHIDRAECEHSVTLFLGGNYSQLWPIWMQQDNKDPEAVVLEEGDCVVYQGNKLNHWRDNFEGTDYYQLFMHYVEADGQYKDKIFDSRPYFGLPGSTKRDYGYTNNK